MTTERFMEIFNDEDLRNKTNVRWGDKEIKFPPNCHFWNNKLYFDHGTTRVRVEELEEFTPTDSEKYVELKNYVVAVEAEIERVQEVYRMEMAALEDRLSMLED